MPRHWFIQAGSDLRVAEALNEGPLPMKAADVGCHVAAMCAQVLEKTLKGCFLLIGMTPRQNHRPDKELHVLWMHPTRHKAHLSKLFDQSTREDVSELLLLTPGGQQNRDAPNTEYPWLDNGTTHVPAVSECFQDEERIEAWLKLARRIYVELDKVRVAEALGRPAHSVTKKTLSSM